MSRADCLGQEATFCSEPAVMRLSQLKVVKVIIGAGDFALLRFVCRCLVLSHTLRPPPSTSQPLDLFLMHLVKSRAWPSLLLLSDNSTRHSELLTYFTSISHMLRPLNPYCTHRILLSRHVYILAFWNLHQCNAC